jgi:hypothetical protein
MRYGFNPIHVATMALLLLGFLLAFSFRETLEDLRNVFDRRLLRLRLRFSLRSLIVTLTLVQLLLALGYTTVGGENLLGACGFFGVMLIPAYCLLLADYFAPTLSERFWRLRGDPWSREREIRPPLPGLQPVNGEGPSGAQPAHHAELQPDAVSPCDPRDIAVTFHHRPRPLFRLSLRAAVVVMLVGGAGLAWNVNKMCEQSYLRRQQHVLIEELKEGGAGIECDSWGTITRIDIESYDAHCLKGEKEMEDRISVLFPELIRVSGGPENDQGSVEAGRVWCRR